MSEILAPKSQENYAKASISSLSNFQLDTTKIQELPTIFAPAQMGRSPQYTYTAFNASGLNETILHALQRSPEISQNIATLAAQGANIDVAKAQYYPQVSGGLSTADLTSGERGRQMLSLSATQMLYDFGKINSSVDIQEAKLSVAQANVLVSIDNVAYETANTIVNIQRYQEIIKIAQQKISGISRIAEITNLRAQAGISSQADPVQARSNVQAAETNLIVQETQLKKFQQRLRTLLGSEVKGLKWAIPEHLVKESDLYTDPEFNKVPNMMSAQAEVDVAKFQKQQSKLSRYPTNRPLAKVKTTSI
ncbi:TolC family protein [Acinetobacter sp. TTH0-4]|uniref:TolC family protein n=1 Tax=Acinetobacter sp. TTH0-4 TaxID=1646498 RepID=UPI0014895932|nr:TolC family protein [Acinetobacter sp. TTH0-4]